MKTGASEKRWVLCLFGTIVMWVGQAVYGFDGIFLVLVGGVLSVWGSYIWAKGKGQSGWWCLLGTFAPIGYLGLLFLGNRAVGEGEREKYIDYLSLEHELAAFQDKEAELYNNAVVQYGHAMVSDDIARKEMCRAGDRLSQAANEILVRRSSMVHPPGLALGVYYAWQTFYLNYSAWASAQNAAIQATSKGMQPNIDHVRELLDRTSSSEQKALKEEERLLQAIHLKPDEFMDMANQASAIAAADKWRPKRSRRNN